jgi:hypothetical protein
MNAFVELQSLFWHDQRTIFGAFLDDAAIFVGDENPVNYLRRGIRRSGYEWKKRLGARLRRTVELRVVVGLRGM